MYFRRHPTAFGLAWFRERAPIKVKLTIAFAATTVLTVLGFLIGWRALASLPAGRPGMQAAVWAAEKWLLASGVATIAAAVVLAYWLREVIAVPYAATLARMEGLAAGDLESDIAYTLHEDCIGRMTKAMFTLRDNAMAKNSLALAYKAQADDVLGVNGELTRLTRHLVQARDIAEHASRAKSRFLASMSHELRTPLNGLLGYAHLLRMEGSLDKLQQDRLRIMMEAGAHLLDMVNRVLDLSELESDSVALQPAPVDVGEIAQTCLDLVRPAADGKNLALLLSVAPETPSHVTTDPTRLRQILLNLLGNAVKFTSAGHVALRLGPSLDGSGLLIEVADTGPGVAAACRDQLFQEYGRLNADFAGAVEGAGLGLALSMRLAMTMGGRMGHADNPGGGSIFWLDLPLGHAPAAALPVVTTPVAAIADLTPDNAAERVLRILVVDDLAMNRDIASAFLKAANHEVSCAEGGAEAVAAVIGGHFDVVVMDVRMPDVDGLEATRRIRALEGPRGQVPILALTAQAFAEQVDECRRAGMNGHLTKPFAPENLLASVARVARHGPSVGRDDPSHPDRRWSLVEAAPPASNTAAPEGNAVFFNQQTFSRTAGLISSEALRTFLQTLADRGTALLLALDQPDALTENRAKLEDMAHALGGSAGMFGFERVADVAKAFERALQTCSHDCPALAIQLREAIATAIIDIGARLSKRSYQAA